MNEETQHLLRVFSSKIATAAGMATLIWWRVGEGFPTAVDITVSVMHGIFVYCTVYALSLLWLRRDFFFNPIYELIEAIENYQQEFEEHEEETVETPIREKTRMEKVVKGGQVEMLKVRDHISRDATHFEVAGESEPISMEVAVALVKIARARSQGLLQVITRRRMQTEAGIDRNSTESKEVLDLLLRTRCINKVGQEHHWTIRGMAVFTTPPSSNASGGGG